MLSKIINLLAAIITIYLGWIYFEQTYINNKLEVSLTESEKIYFKDNNNSFYQTKFVLKNKSDFIINNEQFNIPFDSSENLINNYFIKYHINNNITFSFEQNNLSFNISKLNKDDEIEITVITKTMIDIHSLRINEEKFNNKNIFNNKINIVTKTNDINYYMTIPLLIMITLLYILQLKLKLKDENKSWIIKFMEQKEKTEETEKHLQKCIKMYNEMEKEKEELQKEYFELLKLKVKEC